MVYVYCEDTEALIAELLAKHPKHISKDEETGEYTFLVTKNSTKRNGLLTLSAVVARTQEETEVLDSLMSVTVLGTIDEVNTDPVKVALYKSVYDWTIPSTYTDDDGIEQTIEHTQEWGIM